MTTINYDKIRGLIYTEKSNKQLEQNKYCFEISTDCDKNEIKFSLKAIFNVDVVKVNISNVTGKIKRFKGIEAERNRVTFGKGLFPKFKVCFNVFGINDFEI